MATIRDVLRDKGTDVWTIDRNATVYEALELMAEKNVGALPVTENNELVGMFSERDYARKVILKGRSSKETRIREVDTSPVYTVGPEENVESCLALMTDRRVRHLPVIEGGRLCGIVTIGDIGRAIIADQNVFIHDLTAYITGAPVRI